MMQHPIDLLPEAVRVRSQAGVRTGRYVTAAVLITLVLVLLTTHSWLTLKRARAEYQTAREQADMVLATEARAESLRQQISEIRTEIDRYDRIALPLDVSAVLATIANGMPNGMTLDRIDFEAGAYRIVRSPRSKGADEAKETPPRALNGEVSGFAPTDREIAEFVGYLSDTPPFENVSLDFSRTRVVRDRSAREFRLSFRIDLETPYDIELRESWREVRHDG
jgi:hypothetical protein